MSFDLTPQKDVLDTEDEGMLTYEQYCEKFHIIFMKMFDAFGEEAMKEWANWSPPVKHKKDWAAYRNNPDLLEKAEKAEDEKLAA